MVGKLTAVPRNQWRPMRKGESMPDLSHAVWQKSTYSGRDGCVEIAFIDGHVAIRDSKDRQGPTLLLTSADWEAFVDGVRDGEFAGP